MTSYFTLVLKEFANQLQGMCVLTTLIIHCIFYILITNIFDKQ